VWDGEYPWDVRVEKISRALTAAGHTVNLLARNRTGRPIHERFPEATVDRLAPWHWAPKWLSNASMFPTFVNPRWVVAILDACRRTRADVILSRDLPLAITSILAGRRLRIPVVLDNAENYPAMLQARWHAGRMKPLDVLIRNPRFARAIERWVLQRVDHVLVVVDEARDRLLKHRVPPQRISVVSNTPPLERLEQSGAAHNGGSQGVHIVYLGLIEETRGVKTLLDAAGVVERREVAFRLTILGDGREFHEFRRYARDLGLLGPKADFRGRVPNAQALAALRDAHIGVIPHFADECWDTTVPNKLFDYMAAGLAVVTSDAAPAARIVRETGAGLVFRHGDAADLGRAIEMLADPARRRACGRAAREAIRTTYHWELDVRRLLDALEGVVASHQSSAHTLSVPV
jgi:glycosyltransferase involved in cell wall biosynthesis